MCIKIIQAKNVLCFVKLQIRSWCAHVSQALPSEGIPCRHIFGTLATLQQPLFDPKYFNPRWEQREQLPLPEAILAHFEASALRKEAKELALQTSSALEPENGAQHDPNDDTGPTDFEDHPTKNKPTRSIVWSGIQCMSKTSEEATKVQEFTCDCCSFVGLCK